jgi:hypothetical protein
MKKRVSMNTIRLMQGLLFVTGLAYAGAASAQENPSAAPEAGSTAGAEVLSADDLGNLSGGTGVTPMVLTEQTLTAVNSGNTVTGQTVTSGDVNVGTNAFSGFNGVGNFVFNTGHNNNLQSSMNITVVLPPPPPPPPGP